MRPGDLIVHKTEDLSGVVLTPEGSTEHLYMDLLGKVNAFDPDNFKVVEGSTNILLMINGTADCYTMRPTPGAVVWHDHTPYLCAPNGKAYDFLGNSITVNWKKDAFIISHVTIFLEALVKCILRERG